jgi:peptide/nickel transport system ATP-binding protein/oligopeptide transport system ATP-binding protein
MTEALIRVERLSRSFASTGRFGTRAPAVKAVDEVSFDVRAGETLALVGESGCGKSTTGRLLLRLLKPSGGRVFYEDTELTRLSERDMRPLRRKLQVVFQDPYGSLSPRRTVGEIIAEPLLAHGLVTSAKAARERVAELLSQVGLAPEHARRYPRQFSGGQRQRIGIARAIAVGPRFIVADEPVSALDVSVQAQIVNLLQDLQEASGVAYLFIAHDLAVVRHIADRVAVMYLGRIVEIGANRQVYEAPQHPYTQALLSAAPEPDPDAARRRIVLEGDVPNPARVPPGCAFHTRCPIATERCRRERPELSPVAQSQWAACHFAKPNPIPLG